MANKECYQPSEVDILEAESAMSPRQKELSSVRESALAEGKKDPEVAEVDSELAESKRLKIDALRELRHVFSRYGWDETVLPVWQHPDDKGSGSGDILMSLSYVKQFNADLRVTEGGAAELTLRIGALPEDINMVSSNLRYGFLNHLIEVVNELKSKQSILSLSITDSVGGSIELPQEKFVKKHTQEPEPPRHLYNNESKEPPRY